jgi:hypothetical protein
MVLSGKVKVVLGVFLIVGTVLASIFGWIHVPPVMAWETSLSFWQRFWHSGGFCAQKLRDD